MDPGSIVVKDISPGRAVVWASILFICAYFTKNIFFHALSSYPGPKIWAASRLPWCWNQYRGNLNHRLLELHEKYGPVIRVAPDELSYVTEGAWKTIYGQRSVEMAKDPNFSLLTPSGVQNIMTADRETHVRQRRLLSHAFSEKALREQEPLLQKYCTKLCSQLEDHCRSGPVDMAEWYTFSTFDLIGDLAFGQSFGCLDSGTAPPFVEGIKAGSRELTLNQMLRYYGILFLRPLLSLLEPRGVAGARAANMRRVVQTVRARIARGPTAERRDFWHYILRHLEDGVGDDAIGGADSKVGMTEAEMYANAFSITIAGSEGTATALAGATYLLLRHPEAHRRAVDEVRAAFAAESEITMGGSTALKLPFLDAVLHEALRLYPPVAITFPRRVPAGGEVIDGRFVPEGYLVGVNHLACYRSERNFKQATAFRPERWLESVSGKGGQGDNIGCWQPFSYGPRNCLGRNLAWAEMRLILARVLWRFDAELVLTEENLHWMDGQKIWGFWHKNPLHCVIKPVRRE